LLMDVSPREEPSPSGSQIAKLDLTVNASREGMFLYKPDPCA
jgi:hypothetical protein